MQARIRSTPFRREAIRWVLVAMGLMSLYLCGRRPTEVLRPMAPCLSNLKEKAVKGAVVGHASGRNIFAEEAELFVFQKLKRDQQYFAHLREREKWASNLWEETLLENLKENSLNEENFVILALANIGMKEMTMNWIASLIRNKFTKFVVICFDFQIYLFLCEYGFERNAAMVPRAWLHKDISATFEGWLSEGYKDLLHGKILIMIELWKRNIAVFYNDVDLVFLSDKVFEHLMFETVYTKPDFMYMIDGVDTDGVVYMNGGFWLARPTADMITIFKRVFRIATTRPEHVIDQSALNHVMHFEFGELKRDNKRFVALSKSLYPNGLYIAKEDMNAKLGVYPLMAHFNYMVGNAPKKAVMKQLNMWYVGETFADVVSKE